MSFTVIRNSSHKAWLESRAGGIGSSEVGTILGINPFQTPYQLWRSKLGLDGPQVEQESVVMKMGHYLEPIVARLYSEETGAQIIKSSENEFVVVDDARPYMRVSPDRYAWKDGRSHRKDNKMIVECKTTQKPVDEDAPHDHWVVQLMYQMGVCEIEHGALAWLVQGRDFGYRDIPFDKDLYAYITEEVTRFWTDNILGRKEPPLMDCTDVVLKYPTHAEGKTLEASGEIYDKFLELREVREEIKRLTAVKEECEAMIKQAMGDAEKVVYAPTNEVLATWRSPKESVKFNSELFRTENAALYDKYMLPSVGARRFLVK